MSKIIRNFKLFLIGIVTLFIVACGNNNADQYASYTGEQLNHRNQYMDHLKLMEINLMKSDEINDSAARHAIKVYADYAMFFPNDSLSANYLFKAGSIATGSKKYKQALIQYQTITSKYPNFKYVMESLYLQGFLLDNFMNDDAGAKLIYEKVIAKYPNTNCSRDAQLAINNFGKTDEQLIEEFKIKNKSKK